MMIFHLLLLAALHHAADGEKKAEQGRGIPIPNREERPAITESCAWCCLCCTQQCVLHLLYSSFGHLSLQQRVHSSSVATGVAELSPRKKICGIIFETHSGRTKGRSSTIYRPKGKGYPPKKGNPLRQAASRAVPSPDSVPLRIAGTYIYMCTQRSTSDSRRQKSHDDDAVEGEQSFFIGGASMVRTRQTEYCCRSLVYDIYIYILYIHCCCIYLD